MADFDGVIGTGLSSQAGTAAGRYTLDGVSPTASATRPTPPTDFTYLLFPDTETAGVLDPTGEHLEVKFPPVDFAGEISWGPGLMWFEDVYSYPPIIELGNILSTVVRDIEVYNAYRDESRSLTAAVNNAGSGISFLGLPSLPANISPNDGLQFQVQVSTQGTPTIDGTLDFTTDVGDVNIQLTGNRVVMFAFQPESPITETLEFVTDIIRAVDGTEQRISIREYPRQLIDFKVRMVEGEERRKLEAFLFNWHGGIFGVPIWFEQRKPTSNISSGDFTIQVNTDYADFRDQGLAILWESNDHFEALEISSFTGSSITFSSEVTSDFTAVNTLVMPLRVGLLGDTIPVSRALNDLEDIDFSFTITDNEVDLADTSAFNSYNSRVMLDDENWMSSLSIPDNLLRQIERFDNVVGKPQQFSDWARSQYMTRKGFFCYSPQRTWQVRQLIHALRGSQVSFYLPTFYKDIEITGNIVSGTAIVDIANIGYTTYVTQEEPNTAIWIQLNDLTTVVRQVTGSAVLDSTTERLTVDTNWSTSILSSEIKRVSFLRLSRIADDRIVFTHNNAGKATAEVNVRGVPQ